MNVYLKYSHSQAVLKLVCFWRPVSFIWSTETHEHGPDSFMWQWDTQFDGFHTMRLFLLRFAMVIHTSALRNVRREERRHVWLIHLYFALLVYYFALRTFQKYLEELHCALLLFCVGKFDCALHYLCHKKYWHMQIIHRTQNIHRL